MHRFTIIFYNYYTMTFLYYFWTSFHIIYKPLHKYFNEFLLKYNISYIIYSNKILSKILDFLSGLFLSTYYYLDFKNNKSSKILLFIKLRNNNIHNIKKFNNIIKLKILVKIFNFCINSKLFKNYVTNFRLAIKLFENFILLSFFLKKYFFNLFNFIYFLQFNKNNVIKIYYIFMIKIIKYLNKLYNNDIKKKKFFDLIRFSDWYKYVFGSKIIVFSKNRKIKIHKNIEKSRKLYREFKLKRFNYLLKIYKVYTKNMDILKKFSITYKNLFLLQLKNFYTYKFNFKLDKTKLVEKYPIRFSDSSINKYIHYDDIKNYNFFFIRKNKIFNKSRYSRNRQLYRTGVYWCLWLNIIIVYGLFFLFYRFTFNFGYIWYGVAFLLYSFIFSKVLKYNLINIFTFFKEFYLLFQWYGYILYNVLTWLKKITLKKLNNLNKILFVKNYIYFDTKIFVDNNFVIRLIKFYNKIDLLCFKILWTSLKEKDESFLRYKTIIHFFKQLININNIL